VLGADVVVEEPWLGAVFCSARVEILHDGRLGAGCDRALSSGSFSGSVRWNATKHYRA
jgi:hypothetical protein